MKWYFQETPHDLYDYDSAAEPIIVDMDVAGHKRQVIIHPTKNGFTYVYDRETGKFLHSFPYSAPNWNKGIDEQGNPIDPIVPKDQKDYLVCPSIHTGGRGIQHSAYSPRTGFWYTSDFELCSHFINGGDKGDELNPKVPPNISAYDPATGKKQWTFNTRYYNMSSLLATAGDLIIGGDLDGDVFALDARTGQKLWSFNTGGRIASAAVSYSVNGRQYIAIGSGGGSETEGRLSSITPTQISCSPRPRCSSSRCRRNRREGEVPSSPQKQGRRGLYKSQIDRLRCFCRGRSILSGQRFRSTAASVTHNPQARTIAVFHS